jgi:hypothetical protein
MLDNISRSQIVRWVGYYMLIVGVLRLCIAPLAGLASGLSFVGGLVGGVSAPFTDEAADEIAANSGSLLAASGILAVLTVVSIVAGIAMLIVGIGLLQRRSWSRMGVVVVLGISVAISILELLTGGGISQIVWIVVGGYVVYLFYTDPGIKAELGG